MSQSQYQSEAEQTAANVQDSAALYSAAAQSSHISPEYQKELQEKAQYELNISNLFTNLQSYQDADPKPSKEQALPLLRSLKYTLFDIADKITKAITARREPVQDLSYIIRILQDNHQEVILMIDTPALELEDVENQFANLDIESQEKVKQDLPVNYKSSFYRMVLGNITAQMLGESHVQKNLYMRQILQMVHIVMTKYLANDPLNEDLLQVSSNLFNWDKELHKHVIPNFVSEEILLFDSKMNTDQQRAESEQERQWKLEEVKQGTKVDVIRSTRVDKTTFQSWTRGTVIGVGFPEGQEDFDPDRDMRPFQEVQIKLDGMQDEEEAFYNIMDHRYAPVGTYTQDHDWRDQLQVGDNIDAVDNEMDWYRSTVLKVREAQTNQGETVKQLLVGYRYYHEEGNKIDEKGKYFGWSTKYDEWRDAYDTKIQRYNSVCYEYTRVDQKNYNKNLKMDDRGDTLSQNGKPHYFAFPRKQHYNKSNTIVDAFNVFGRNGGFEQILDFVKGMRDGKIQGNLRILNSISMFLKATLPLWHREFVAYYALNFNEAFMTALCYVNEEYEFAVGKPDPNSILGPFQQQEFNTVLLENFVNQHIDPIWRRYNTEEIVQRRLSDYQLNLGAALLSLSKLERRIAGFRYIGEAIKAVKANPYAVNKHRTPQQLIDVIRRLGIFEMIFGARTHFELVHKSQNLLKMMFQEKCITEQDIEMIWEVCNKQGEQIKLEVYSIILEVLQTSYTNLSESSKLQFIKKLEGITPEELMDKDVSLLHELGKRNTINTRAPEEYQVRAAAMMWSIAIREHNYPLEIIKFARKNFSDLTTNWEDRLKQDYIDMSIQNIRDAKFPLQNLKICTKLIESWTDSHYQATGGKVKQDLASELLKAGLLDLVIDDLDKYMTQANESFKKGELTLQNSNTFEINENHCFSHDKNLKSRMNRISNLLKFAQMKITTEQIMKLWDILVQKSELRSKDQNEFMLWFKKLMAKDNQYVSEETMLELFRTKISQGDYKMFKSLKINGFDVIVRLFVLVNELEGNVQDLEQESQTSGWGYNQNYGYNYNYQYNNRNYDGTYGQNKNKFNRFRVHVIPRNLIGIEILWQMMRAVDTKENLGLFNMVQKTLNNIYSNLSSMISDKTSQVYDDFVKSCLECLESIVENNFVKRSDDQIASSLRFICKMLMSFFELSESMGVGNMRPHRSIATAPWAEQQVFDIRIPIRREIDASKFHMNFYTNMTVWQLKCILSQHIDSSPLCISLKRSDSKFVEMKDASNLKLVSDLKLTKGEVIEVQKARNPETVDVPLIDKRKEVAPELNAIFCSWFKRFSTEFAKTQIIQDVKQLLEQSNDPFIEDKLKDLNEILDEYPGDSMRVMTRPDCANFVKEIANVTDVSPENYRISGLYDNYCRKLGYSMLLLEEFLTFYETQSKTKPETVKQNLSEFGIGPDLKQIVDTNRLIYETDFRMVKNEVGMPRQKLSQNDEMFDKLFDLIDKASTDDVSKTFDESLGMWQLLMCLQTNETLYQKVLTLEGLDSLLYVDEQDMSKVNIYKVFYTVQIMQSLIAEYAKTKESTAILSIDLMAADRNRQVETILRQENIGNLLELHTLPKSLQEGEKFQEKLKPEKYEEEFPALDDEPTKPAVDADKPQIMTSGSGLSPYDPISVDNIDSPQIEEKQQQQNPQYAISSNAIPLPPPDSMGGQGQGGGNTAYTNPNAPVAPPSAAASIGAPSQNNVSKKSEKGDELKFLRRLDQGIARNPEEKEQRMNWLPNFLSQGGLNKLVNLFRSFSQYSRSGPSNIKVIKLCLGQILECVKVLLVSQLSAKTTEDKLPQQLDDDSKNKLLDEILTLVSVSGPLIELIRTNEAAALEVDIKAFLQELMSIISEYISLQSISIEDEQIINLGVIIWLSCLSYEPSLLNHMMDLQNADEHTQRFVELFIEKGLMSTEFRVRETFSNAIKHIISTVSGSNDLIMPANVFFLKLLASKFDFVTQNNVDLSHQTKLYFSIFQELVEEFFKFGQGDQVFQMIGGAEFVRSLVYRLMNYQPNESKRKLNEDYTLIGFFNLIRIFLDKNQQTLDFQSLEALIRDLVEKCLFSKEFIPLEQDINKDVNLEQHEKSLIQKCLTKESISACFNLLLTAMRSAFVYHGQEGGHKMLFEILINTWQNQLYAVKKPHSHSFSPSAQGRSNIYNYCGIRNLGAVCYMNSMNQQFFQVPAFRYCLLAAQDMADPNWQEPDLDQYKGNRIDDDILHQMMNLFGALELSDRQAYDPTHFCFSVKSFGEPTNVREQKDASEYLLNLFDKLESKVKHTPMKYLVSNIFGGKVTQSKTCKNCGHERRVLNDILHISLEVKNQKSIESGLKKYISPDIIQDYQCENCQKKVDLAITNTVAELPNTLIIHLQRIMFDFEVERNVKLNDKIEFPERLNMKQFMTKGKVAAVGKSKEDLEKDDLENAQQPGIKREESKISAADDELPEGPQNLARKMSIVNEDDEQAKNENDQKEEDQEPDDDYEYRLVGVVDHMGTADAGHYFSYINVERDKEFKSGDKKTISKEEFFDPKKSTWLEFNDNQVKYFSVKDLESNCFGGDSNQSAYMLFYEKRLKKKMKIVLPKEIFEKESDQIDENDLAYDSAVMSRKVDEMKDQHLFKVIPGLVERIKNELVEEATTDEIGAKCQEQDQDTIYYDKELKEHVILSDMYDTCQFIPKDIYQNVHYDNKTFLDEKLVFSESFFGATAEMIKMVNEGAQQNQEWTQLVEFNQVFQLLDKIVYDYMANSTHLKAMEGMIEQMTTMLKGSDLNLEYMINSRIFMPQEQLGKNEKNFFESLATHAQQEVRSLNSQVMFAVLEEMLEKYPEDYMQDRNCDAIVLKILEQMVSECEKHWMRLEEYFGFLNKLMTSRTHWLKLLIQNRIISRSIELIQKYKANNQIYETVIPPLGNLARLFIIPLMYFPRVLDASEHQQLDSEQTMQLLTEWNTNSTFRRLQDTYKDEIIDLGEISTWLQLSTECLTNVFMKNKPTKEMFANMTSNGWGVELLPDFFAHVCFENKEFSIRCAKYILKGINSGAFDADNIFLQVMRKFFAINDSLKLQRLEWVLGIPYIQLKTNNYQHYNQAPKIGVSNAESINSVITKYISPVHKSALQKSQYTYSRKDCALQSIVSNKNSQSRAVLNFLKSLMTCIIDDKSYHILKYLLTAYPPTYQFARYWDSIKPFVQSEVESNQRYASNSVYLNDLTIALCVSTQIETIEKLQDLPFEMPKLVDGIITYPENDGGNAPYVIWDVKNAEPQPERLQIASSRIEMQINKLTCTISKSFPTGEHNLTLQDAFGKWGRAYNGGSYNNDSYSGGNHRIRQRAHGRGNNISGQGKGIMSSKNKKNKKYNEKNRGRERDRDEEDADSEDDENNNYMEGTGQTKQKNVQFDISQQSLFDDGPQNQGTSINADLTNEIRNKGSYVDDDDDIYGDGPGGDPQDEFQANRNENDDMAANDPMNPLNNIPDNSNSTLDKNGDWQNPYEGGDEEGANQQHHYQREEAREVDMADEEAGVQITDNYNPYSNTYESQDKPDDMGFNAQDKNEDDDKDEGFDDDRDNDNGITLEQNQCILMFKVENSAAYRQCIQFTIRPRTDQNGQPLGTLNFNCPTSPIWCEVGANQNCIVLMATKLDPAREDWGEFDWFFNMVENQISNVNYSNNNNYNQYSAIDNNYGMNDTDIPMANVAEQSGTGGAAPSTSGGGAKSCPACTFDNLPSATRCEICGGAL